MHTYLFDFDGTLVDSMPYYVGVMKKILDDNGISYGSDLVKIITPLGFVGTAKYFKGMGIPLTEEEMIKKNACACAARVCIRRSRKEKRD